MNTDVMDWQQAPAASSRMRIWMPWLALVILSLVAAQSYMGAGPQLSRLDIHGEFERVLPREVHEAAAPLLQAGFFDLDLDAVRGAVEANPWVARARVDRSWPKAVQVTVWEHQPVALWGEGQVLSASGALFAPRQLPEFLPQLAGPDGLQDRVHAAWEALSFALTGTPFALSGLRLDARDNWVATTARGVELRLGRGDPLRRLPVLLGPAHEALNDELARVAHIDLRYANGFSVGWRLDEMATEEGNG